MRNIFFLIPFLLLQTECHANAYRAFCKSAVADIVSAPFAKEHSTYEQVKAEYENLPASWGPSRADQLACPRIHQILLHEIVTVTEETTYEAHVEVLSLIAVRDAFNVQTLHGWMLKDHLIALNKKNSSLLPPPIEWQQGIICDNAQTIALISPFIDKNTLYSSGTRFLLAGKDGEMFRAITYDEQFNNFKEITIPEQLCAYQPTLADHDKRMLFCTLISLWSDLPGVAIPLVWGGASIGRAYADNDFYLVEHKKLGQTLKVWERPLYGSTIHMGLDASNLVSRAAQLVGIPYFCKNSITASLILNEVAADEYPLPGDLIWIPGSLLIIDTENNSIITAMSYSSGYGTITKLPLSAVFKDIQTLNDLLDARDLNQPLSVLNKDGSIAREVQEFKILKLM